MNEPRIVRHDQAQQDLAELAAYISEESPAAALRFLEAAEETFRQIAVTPRIGRPRPFNDPDLAGLRSWPVRRFRSYLIFYIPHEDNVEIIRVLHGARDIERIFEE